MTKSLKNWKNEKCTQQDLEYGEEVLNKLSGVINEDDMIELNYKVDEEGQTPEKVAHDYLVLPLFQDILKLNLL